MQRLISSHEWSNLTEAGIFFYSRAVSSCWEGQYILHALIFKMISAGDC